MTKLRWFLALLVTLVSLGSLAGSASADLGLQQWTYPGHSGAQNCWRVANDNPSLSCDTAGANYLLTNDPNNPSIKEWFRATQSQGSPNPSEVSSRNGDYETTWAPGGEALFNTGDPWSLSPYSGFDCSSQAGSNQACSLTNSTNQSSAVQLYSNQNGWWINGTDSGSNCGVGYSCNSYHWLDLKGSTADYPFATEFSNASLNVSGAVFVHNTSGTDGSTSHAAFTTAEPYLLDTSTTPYQVIDPTVLLTDTATAANRNAAALASGTTPGGGSTGELLAPFSPNGHPGFYFVTFNRPGERYTTYVSGQSCQGCGGGTNLIYQYKINYTQLKNMITDANNYIAAHHPTGYRTYSTLTRNYRLFYVIDGGEMTGTTTFGGWDYSPQTYTTSG